MRLKSLKINPKVPVMERGKKVYLVKSFIVLKSVLISFSI